MGGGSNWQNKNSQGSNNQGGNKKPVVATFNTNRKKKWLTLAELDEKRANGLCYFCDEMFVPGHNCKAKRHLFSIELEEGGVVALDDVKLDEILLDEEETVIDPVENCAISLQALNGTNGYRTLRVRGFTEKETS
ncbi:uncharacterized protein LOC132032441 [Lycium ferocissimum]|uniref:uncharacterized protein LOC132032441 n=1 Tax=Lycium ferocissimum TaxID=112874 RepID=UPI002815CC42|nr:uncharacterized protein LOC132032441 [Lycium ferocissimum]